MRISFIENIRGNLLVTKTYMEFERLAKEQIRKHPEDGLTMDDKNDVIMGLLITKLLVAEGKLEEKFFESAIS